MKPRLCTFGDDDYILVTNNQALIFDGRDLAAITAEFQRENSLRNRVPDQDEITQWQRRRLQIVRQGETK